MPMYRAKVQCFVGNTLRSAGEEFEYNGEPFAHIEKIGGQSADPAPVAEAEEAEPKKKWTPKVKRASSKGSDK